MRLFGNVSQKRGTRLCGCWQEFIGLAICRLSDISPIPSFTSQQLLQPAILDNLQDQITQAGDLSKRKIIIMSGFEVAGIALGSLPLLVTALEAYCTFMRNWGKIPSELRSLNRQLTTERARLCNICELLISDAVPQEDIAPMLQNPFGPSWRAPETDERIRRRLWDSYGPFEQTITEIQEALDSILMSALMMSDRLAWCSGCWASSASKTGMAALNWLPLNNWRASW